MNYDPHNPKDIEEAWKQLQFFCSAKIPFSLGKALVNRTSQQNRFYHVCVRLFADAIGITKIEAERIFKEVCNPDIFVREYTDKHGNKFEVIRSSADITKDEMTSALNNFRAYAMMYAKVDIPYEEDEADVRAAERIVEQSQSWT